MCLALLIIVLYIFQRGKSRLRKDVEALCARVIDGALGFDGEDVGFAVLFSTNVRMISRTTFGSLGNFGVPIDHRVPSADLARESGISRGTAGCRPRRLL